MAQSQSKSRMISRTSYQRRLVGKSDNAELNYQHVDSANDETNAINTQSHWPKEVLPPASVGHQPIIELRQVGRSLDQEQADDADMYGVRKTKSPRASYILPPRTLNIIRFELFTRFSNAGCVQIGRDLHRARHAPTIIGVTEVYCQTTLSGLHPTTVASQNQQ